jgi:hypothetical protein
VMLRYLTRIAIESAVALGTLALLLIVIG